MTSIPTPTSNDVIIEDTDPRVSYSSVGTWTVVSDGSLSDVGLTYHFTPGGGGAWVASEFEGSYVWYVADKKFNHGNNGVSIDGGPVATISSYDPGLVLGQILFHQAVAPGRHSINVTELDGKVMGIDRFVYRPLDFSVSSPSAGSSSETNLPPPTNSPFPSSPSQLEPQRSSDSQPRRLPAGAYVGIGLGCGALLLLLIGAAVILWFRRQRHSHRQMDMAHCPSIATGPQMVEPLRLPSYYEAAAVHNHPGQDKHGWYRRK
ncbi:hypothetical protein AURDEDRAFT_110053 [Auricularia subglabra TFB-10046 SS5]|nr:hypothetical protein AURDEDRAFT_110053 [Auricularia subglabra TFB-10046 SS5]